MRHLLIASLSLVFASPAVAQADDRALSRAQTEDALERAQDALDGRGVTTGRELTPLLARVAAGRATLRGEDRREARALLARPTLGDTAQDEEGYTVAEATPFCTADFCVHWVESTTDAPDLTDGDNDGVPNVVETIAEEMQNTVFDVENGSNRLNWNQPLSDENSSENGGNDKTDIYLKQLGTTDPTVGSLYGYAATEVDDPDDAGAPAYLVLDDDFAPAEYGQRPTDLSRKATEAHEYNHVLQFTYDWFQDPWLAESTATWAEDQVFPDVDDYLGYLADKPKRWGACLATPLTKFDFTGKSDCRLKVYGSAVWNHWLSRRYGESKIRNVQERSYDADSFAIKAYEGALGGPFAARFGEFAAETAEWDRSLGLDVPLGGYPFPDSYPDLPRAGTLGVDGGALTTQVLDNTTYRLFTVSPDTTKPFYRLHADLPTGLGGGVALVGRTADGLVSYVYGPANASGAADAKLNNPAAWERVTAVIVNGDPSPVRDGNGNPTFTTNPFDWVYAKNGQPFCNVRVTSSTTGSGTAAACPSPPPVVTNDPPPTQPGPAPTPPAATPPAQTVVKPPTVAAPALTFTLSATARQKRATVLKRGVSASVTCNQTCSASATLTIDRKTARSLKLSRTLGSTSARLTKAGKKAFRVKLNRKARAALRKRSRLKATLTIRTKAASGSAKSAKRTIAIVK